MNIDLNGVDGLIMLEWIDAKGSLKFSQEMQSDGSVLQVETNQLPGGVYVLKLIHNGEVSIQRIMIQ